MATLVRADSPAPARDEVVLTLTAKPPLPVESEGFTPAKPGWVFLEVDRSSKPIDPWGAAYQPGPFTLATPGTLSIDRGNLERHPSEGQRGQYRVEDQPGPGYRKIVEWYENMKRPLPKTGP